jgi:hypothetical protein
MSGFRVVGINSDSDECGCCGRKNLAKVVWIENLETGEVDCFGRSCALKPQRCFGSQCEADIEAAFKQFERERKEAQAAEAKAARKAARLAEQKRLEEERKSPEYLAWQAKFHAAVAEAEATFECVGNCRAPQNLDRWIAHFQAVKARHGV